MNRRQAIGSVIATSLAASFSNLFASSENNLEKLFQKQMKSNSPILFYFTLDEETEILKLHSINRSELKNLNLVGYNFEKIKEKPWIGNWLGGNKSYFPDGSMPLLEKKS